MVGYQVPAYSPARPKFVSKARLASPKLGAVGDMNVGDWLLLGGGAVVGGAGVNGLIAQFRARKFNAIGAMFSLVLTGVGVTVFVDKFGKLLA